MLPKDEPPANSPRSRDNFRLVLTSLPPWPVWPLDASTAANEQVNLVFGVWLQDSFGLKIAALGAASAVIGISEMSAEGLVATS